MKIVAIVICLFLLRGTIVSVHAAWIVDETDLNEGGSPYEINPDSEGWLWITDYTAGEIWRVHTDTSGYELYKVEYPGEANAIHPSDARRSGDHFWWVDGDIGIIGRANVVDGEYTLWKVEGVNGFYGTALDASGRLWVSDAIQNKIYSLEVLSNVSSGNICTYTLPANSYTYYFASMGEYLWLGDYGNSTLIRMSIDDEIYGTATWELPEFSMPFGLALDGNGHLWYADIIHPVLRELNPDANPNMLRTYTLPDERIPYMITALEGNIWYTGYDNSLGVLDPSIAVPNTQTVTPSIGELEEICTTITPVPTSEPAHLSSVSGSIGWSQTSYSTLVDENGWKIYSMPLESVPWGIAFQDRNVYVVDKGRQVLVRLPVYTSVFLPLITR